MKQNQMDTFLSIIKQINDPFDSFFIGLAFKKELNNHKSVISDCLQYIKKENTLSNDQIPNWRQQIYYDYIQQIDQSISCQDFLQKYINLPKQDQDKTQQNDQIEFKFESSHSFQQKNNRQNSITSQKCCNSPTFNKVENVPQNEQLQLSQRSDVKQKQYIEQHQQVEQPQICRKCNNKIYQSDLFQISCLHTFHIKCFQKGIGKQLQQELFPIKCLEKDCIYIPNMDEMNSFLDKNQFELYQNCYEKYNLNQGRIIICPNQSCKQKFICGSPQDKFTECIFCRQEICLICFRIRHVGLDCEQIFILNPHEIKELVDQNKQKMNKQCPNCKILHKNEECYDLLRCICGLNFCTVCSKDSYICKCPYEQKQKQNNQKLMITQDQRNTPQSRRQFATCNTPANQDSQFLKNQQNLRAKSSDQSKRHFRQINTGFSQFNEKLNTQNNSQTPSSQLNSDIISQLLNKNMWNNINRQNQQNNSYQSRDLNTEMSMNNTTNNFYSNSNMYNKEKQNKQPLPQDNVRLKNPIFQSQKQQQKHQNSQIDKNIFASDQNRNIRARSYQSSSTYKNNDEINSGLILPLENNFTFTQGDQKQQDFTSPSQQKKQINNNSQQQYNIQIFQDNSNENQMKYPSKKGRESESPQNNTLNSKNQISPSLQGIPYKSLQYNKHNLPKLYGVTPIQRGLFLQNSMNSQQMNEFLENNLSQRSNQTQMQKSLFDDENEQYEDTFKDTSYLAESRFKQDNSFVGYTTTQSENRQQTPQRGVSPYRIS